MRYLRFLLLVAIYVGVVAQRASAEELRGTVQTILADRCGGCHDETEKSGGINIIGLMADFHAGRDVDTWIKIESAITKQKMPPDGDPLDRGQIDIFSKWFEKQFEKPGGAQHAGLALPRRLTREEMQNTLEDIVHVKIRAPVTNSRLHVIPDTIIEKCFTAGVVGESGFSNDAVMLSKESIDIQTYARCFSMVLSLLDSDSTARKKLFGTDVLPLELSANQARQIIDDFGRSTFRRGMTEDELSAVYELYEKSLTQRPVFQAMKSALLAVLLSPPFLYRFEEPISGQSPVSDNELAVRLSYFLWSAPPDEELLTLAAEGKLQDNEVLRQQVHRLLADPKRIALAENLGGEWFDYKKLRQQSSVNKRSDQMAGFYRTQYEEALLMFDSILRYDQSILSIVDADWAFMNQHQANIYGLRIESKQLETAKELPPISIHFRSHQREVSQGNYEYKHLPLALVKVNDPDRVGFLTLGPTLSVTSTENRTSPIRRGVWVMERILGEHFVVPENVPDLEATQQKAKARKLELSPNEILKLHSSQQGCASCHQYIDPIGFGLEKFDQLGIGHNRVDGAPSGEKLQWTPELTHKSYADQTWTLNQPLVADAQTRVYFHYTKGGHRLNVKNVRIHSGGVEIVDTHAGFAGNQHRDNVWVFTLPRDAPSKGWQLTAEIEGDGGTDSHGIITVAGPNDQSPGHQLPGGKSFTSPAELKDLLVSDFRDQVIDNVVNKVLAYAVGRKLLPIDRPAIREIKAKLASQNDRMTALIEAVVLSYPFRHKEFE